MITKSASWGKMAHDSVRCCHRHCPLHLVVFPNLQAKERKYGRKKRKIKNASHCANEHSHQVCGPCRNGRLGQFQPQALYNHISFRTIKIALQPRISLNPIPDLESWFPSARHLALLGSWHTYEGEMGGRGVGLSLPH